MTAPNIAAVRRRFEEHELLHYTRARLLQHAPGDRYENPITQSRWELWQAAQPGPLNLTSARAYLSKLETNALLSTPGTAILRRAQHLMRCIRNDNPEYF
jgi:hypothetical protein